MREKHAAREKSKAFEMGSEETFVMIKPDGVSRGLIGEIISRFEREGLRIKALRMLRVDDETAMKLYEEHVDKSFFGELVNHIKSGPVVAMILEADNAIKKVRDMIGATDPNEARVGTVRGDFALDITHNVIHAVDSEERVRREIELFFDYSETLFTR